MSSHKVSEELEAAHIAAHALQEQLASTISTFLMALSQSSTPSGVVALLATEMQASILRRYCRDAGANKEFVETIRTLASKCGREIYEDQVAFAAKLQEAGGVPVPPPAGEYEN